MVAGRPEYLRLLKLWLTSPLHRQRAGLQARPPKLWEQ